MPARAHTRAVGGAAVQGLTAPPLQAPQQQLAAAAAWDDCQGWRCSGGAAGGCEGVATAEEVRIWYRIFGYAILSNNWQQLQQGTTDKAGVVAEDISMYCSAELCCCLSCSWQQGMKSCFPDVLGRAVVEGLSNNSSSSGALSREKEHSGVLLTCGVSAFAPFHLKLQ
eukprot:scaffold89030_cov22-Tisochrysis_lutea.AAC.1